MKKTFLALLACIGAQSLIAQSSVTFVVEVPANLNASTVDVTGNWLDSANGAIPGGANWTDGLNLTNVGGNTWAGTVNNMQPGTYEYKFRVYPTGASVIWDAANGCGVGPDNNRPLVVAASSTVAAGPYCFKTCNAACATTHAVTVNFKVDMQGVNRTIPAACNTFLDSIHVAGNFGVDAGKTGDWVANDFPLSLIPGSSKQYGAQIAMLNKKYQFKFLRSNNWTCTSTTPQTEFSEQKLEFGNDTLCLTSGGDREIDLSNAAPNSTVDVSYKWQTCLAATPLNIKKIIDANVLIAVPNPFNNGTQLQFTNEGKQVQSIVITNSVGQVIKTFTDVSGNSLSLGNLPTGVYQVVLHRTSGSTQAIRILAQ
jgi:hypothetical protein